MNVSLDYNRLSEQVNAIICEEPDIIANMANIRALLFEPLNDINWLVFTEQHQVAFC